MFKKDIIFSQKKELKMKKDEKQIKSYNNLIDFLEVNIFSGKQLCFGVVYSNFKLKQITEEDFLYIISNYFLNDVEF